MLRILQAPKFPAGTTHAEALAADRLDEFALPRVIRKMVKAALSEAGRDQCL
jgi:hypothetical protein